MPQSFRRRCRASGLALGATTALAWASLAWASLAWAGGGTFGDDEEDVADTGHPYIGYVRDNAGKTIADAKITVELKNGSVILRADDDGHFSVRGFGKGVDPEDVKITCSKDGYKEIAHSKRAASDDPKAPVEVNCVLAPDK